MNLAAYASQTNGKTPFWGNKVIRLSSVRKIGLLLSIFLTICFLSVSSIAADTLKMHVLYVGQGQGVLFEFDGHYMMVDGGGRGSSSFVVSYLKQQGIKTLDCVVVSHYEEDHMSGIIGILSAFPCDLLLVPSYAGSGEIYQSLAVAALSNGCEILHPQPGYDFMLGDADVKIVGPWRNDYSSDNDLSLCFHILYGNCSFLVCGDAQQESEMDLVNSGEDLRSDVYVVDHHCSHTSSMDAFLDVIAAQYAVISCGKDNGYGHPSMEALQRLQNHGVSMFRTDQQGTIIAYTDGSKVWFDIDPSDDWSSGSIIIPLDVSDDNMEYNNDSTRLPLGERGLNDLQEEAEPEYQYVCNTSTKKIHIPSCDSVSQTKEENRLYTNLSKDELIAEGYEPCGNCRP